MTSRKTPRENDFATLKQVIEAVGPCAMAIEELDARLARLEAAFLKPTITPYDPGAEYVEPAKETSGAIAESP